MVQKSVTLNCIGIHTKNRVGLKTADRRRPHRRPPPDEPQTTMDSTGRTTAHCRTRKI